jgi:hypothetical protein
MKDAFFPLLLKCEPFVIELHFSSSKTTNCFLEYLVGYIVWASNLILYKPEQIAVQGGQVQTVGWMGEKFPAVLLHPLYTQMNSVKLCAVVLQDYFFLLRTFVIQYIMKCLEYLKLNAALTVKPLWQ